MEDSQLESSKLLLRPHRTPPFKSQTNQVLAQILSLYGDQSQSRRLVKFVPYQHNPDALSFDEDIFNSLGQTNEKGGSEHGVLNRSNVAELEGSLPEKEKLVDESNTKNVDEKGVFGVDKSCISGIKGPESFSSAIVMVDKSDMDKGVCNYDELDILEIPEPKSSSPVREKVVVESNINEGTCNLGDSGLSYATNPEKVSSLKEKVVDKKAVCDHSEFLLAGERVVKESVTLKGVSKHDESENTAKMVVYNIGELGASDHGESEIVTSKVIAESNTADGVCNLGKLACSDSMETESLPLVGNKAVDETITEGVGFNHVELGKSGVTEPEVEQPLNEISDILTAEDNGALLKKRENLTYGGNQRTNNFQNNDYGRERMMIDELEVLVNDVVSVSSMREIVVDKVGVCNHSESGHGAELERLLSARETLAGESSESIGSLENRSREAQLALDEISDILNAEDNENLVEKGENMAYGENEGTDFQNNSMMIDELAALVNDVAAYDHDKIMNACTALKDAQENPSVFSESVVSEPKSMGEVLAVENLRQNDLDSSREDKELTYLSIRGQPESLLASMGTPNKEISVQPLDSGHRTESGEIEEGEVSDIEVLSTLHLENIGLQSEKLDKEQLLEINTVAEKLPSSGLDEGNIKNPESHSFAMTIGSNSGSKGRVEINDSNEGNRCNYSVENEAPERQSNAVNVVGPSLQTRSNSLVFYGDIVEESATTNRGLDLKKQDNGNGKKRKRGPISEEKKGKKKQKERKKRAEKNRELGVKRLKLQPVVMPKIVSICRHYLKGRCQEGEKCKFSHDAVPLTKSKPCVHFARRSCMKGDDCPFDHELSKYPCDNYASKGFCNRGDNCLFSHKIVSKEDQGVGTDASKQGQKPSSATDNLKSKQQQPVMINAPKKAASDVLKDLGISFKGMGQSTPNPLAQSSIGKSQISSSNSVGRPSPVKSELGDSSSKKKDEGRLVNQTAEISLAAAQKSNDNVKARPSLAPKGLNFLSFGRTSGDESGGIVDQTASAPSSRKLDDNVKTRPSLAPKGINFLSFARNNPYSSKSGSLFSSVDEKGKSAEPNKVLITADESPSRPEGLKMKNLLCGEAQIDGASTSKEATSPPQSKHINDCESVEGANKLEKSSLKSLMLGFSTSSGQSSGWSTPVPHKNITNSAQKALSSTLAFAAMCEKETTTKKSCVSGVVVDQAIMSSEGSNKRKSSGGAQEYDSAKTLKILDFLASMSRKH